MHRQMGALENAVTSVRIVATASLIRTAVTLPIRRKPSNDPHKLPSRRSVGPAAEPPWAARNCSAAWRAHLAPSELSSVAAPAPPRWSSHVGRLAA
jgi:hypothetical protein